MVIRIVHPDKFIIDLPVEANDTIGNVKAIITWEEGIPHKQQRLSFRPQRLSFETKLLEDDSTLSDNNIQNGDTLKLHEEVICKCMHF